MLYIFLLVGTQFGYCSVIGIQHLYNSSSIQHSDVHVLYCQVYTFAFQYLRKAVGLHQNLECQLIMFLSFIFTITTVLVIVEAEIKFYLYEFSIHFRFMSTVNVTESIKVCTQIYACTGETYMNSKEPKGEIRSTFIKGRVKLFMPTHALTLLKALPTPTFMYKVNVHLSLLVLLNTCQRVMSRPILAS